MPRSPKLLALGLALGLSATGPLCGPLCSPAWAQPAQERAAAARSRGDLRAAQLEWRNVVRDNPTLGAAHAGLAASSLELGDTDTAEREARAALQRGYEPAAGHALLLRVLLAQGRFQELLGEFGEPGAGTPDAVGAQIFAARALAQLSLNDQPAAQRSVTEALRLGPGVVEPGLAAAAVLRGTGDPRAAEAQLDRVLTIEPNNNEALLRKGGMQLERGDLPGSLLSYDRAVAATPGDVPALLRRAELLLRMGQPARARADLDAALTSIPNSVAGLYLRAMLLVGERDWRGADASLQPIAPQLASLPDGLLLLAMTKRGLGQAAQAEDAARRHLARWPEDPRGAKLVAVIDLDAGRPEPAAAALNRAAAAGPRDPELFDLLGRAEAAAGRPAPARAALEHAVTLAPTDGGLVMRLAVARLAAGDPAGAQAAAEAALRIDPAQLGAREMLAAAAMARGDLAAANAELERLPAAARQGDTALQLQGTLRLLRLDQAGASTAFETLLRQNANSGPARIGLARVALLRGDADRAAALLAEALQRDPGQVEARRALLMLPESPASAAALRSVQAAAPADPILAVAAANSLLRQGQPAAALALLDTPALRAQRGSGLPLARARISLAANDLPAAQAATAEALAEEPASIPARQLMASLMARAGDPAGAEGFLRAALVTTPANPPLAQALVGLVMASRGPEAGLAEARRLATAFPALASLPGDALRAARQPEQAAQAYAAALAQTPSSDLVQRLAGAWQAAGKPDEAVTALQRWLDANPEDVAARNALAQFDILANRWEPAAAGLRSVLRGAAEDGVALNNLAWVLASQGGPERLTEARSLAERAWFVAPSPLTADTLGWVLAQPGYPGHDPRMGVTMLRQASTGDRGTVYRLAFALRAAGDRAEAARILAPALADTSAFPERAQAEALSRDLAR